MRALVALPILMFALPSLAVDGVLEINQVCAVNTGCFSGDTAGFPVTISSAGSYRLTGNLTVSTAADTAIFTTAPSVSVDLNGFTISGPTVCSGAPSAGNFICSPFASGRGVWGASDGITVINGTIEGMGSSGVQCGNECHVENVTFRSNGSLAINVSGLNSTVRRNRIRLNGGGIQAPFGVTTENSLSLVGGNGISAAGLVASNTLLNVELNGISMTQGIVRENEVGFANLFGLSGNSQVAYEGNVFRGNNGGDVNPQVSGGQQTGTNICGGDTICP